MGAGQPSGHQHLGPHSGQTIIDKLNQFKIGAASQLHEDDVVPALADTGIPDR